ncbi:MAG: hypothetical protein J6D54_07135 [Olsenella sp.]|nr:hypothetical protein [Olsenella sp.]
MSNLMEVRGVSESRDHDAMTYGWFEVLATWHARMHGLLGPRARGRPVLLERCRSIHTFGMRYAIDVALVAADGRVLQSVRGLGRGCLLACEQASYVLERPAARSPWPVEGERLVLVAV